MDTHADTTHISMVLFFSSVRVCCCSLPAHSPIHEESYYILIYIHVYINMNKLYAIINIKHHLSERRLTVMHVEYIIYKLLSSLFMLINDNVKIYISNWAFIESIYAIIMTTTTYIYESNEPINCTVECNW